MTQTTLELEPGTEIRDPAGTWDRLCHELAGLDAEARTILERLVRESRADTSALPILRLNREDPRFPLSFAQRRLWFLDQLDPGGSHYNMSAALILTGPLDIAALEAAVRWLVARHEILRTRFPTVEGEPWAVIEPEIGARLRLVDLCRGSNPESEELVEMLAVREAGRPFDLARGPAPRTLLLRLEPRRHLLVLTLHHMLTDAWSMGVLIREIGAAYRDGLRGERPAIPAPRIQYADYAYWERLHQTSADMEAQCRYWEGRLGGSLPVLNLPIDKDRPALPSHRGGSETRLMEPDLMAGLQRLARENDVTMFTLLLSAFFVLLHRTGGQTDLLVGTDAAHRNRVETESLVGFFINQLVLRADLAGNPSFSRLLLRVREAVVGAFAHQDLPYDKLVEMLNPARELSRGPLFQAKFVFQNVPKSTLRLPGLQIERLPLKDTTTHGDLILYMEETERGLLSWLEYDADLFESATIRSLLANLQTLLESAVRNPDADLHTLAAAVDRRERRQHMLEHESRAKSSLARFLKEKPKGIDLNQQRLVTMNPLLEDRNLPLSVTPNLPDMDPAAWAENERDLLLEKLRTHGALLFRGFKLGSVARFSAFCRAFHPELMDYSEGSTPRTRIEGKVYTSTEYPAHQRIPLHNEMSYTRTWPGVLWFGCLQPAERGGETPIADSRRVYQSIRPEIRKKFEREGVMYVRNFGAGLGLTWQQAFQTGDRAQVESYCRKTGIDCEWRGEDGLRTRQVCQAVARHPRSGETVWFNQAHLFHVSNLAPAVAASLAELFSEEELPRNAYYGDGTALEPEVLQEIRDVYEGLAIQFPWQQGDVMMVDNLLAAHGRTPFTGPRKVVVAMADPIECPESP